VDLVSASLKLAGGAAYRAKFEAELISFPAGKHDDQVDGWKPAPPPKPRDSWDEAFAWADGDDQSWRVV
jgi:hypothetical protein